MSEQDAIKKTKNPMDKSTLINFFKTIGIQEEDTVVVHSSLSQLGFVIGGAQTVLESLLEVLKKGTLCMPAHSSELSDPAKWEYPPVPKEWHNKIYDTMPVFDKELTTTRSMGKIANLFLQMKDTLRSNHPQVSFSAYGKDAAYITQDQPLTPMFGKDSPLERLYQLNAKVLLLGVDFDSCTAFHYSEWLTQKMPTKKDGTPMIVNNKRTWVKFEDCDYDDEDFLKIGNKIIEEGIAMRYSIGLSKATIMPIKAAVDQAKEILLKTRFKKD